MALRLVKGKLRVEGPRLKDLPAGPVRDPSVGRGVDGRFASGNRLGSGQAAIAVIRRSLAADGADAEMVREAVVMYRQLLRELPSTGASVRQLVAARVRHAALATRYAGLASEAGLGTPLGIKMAEASRAHDMTASRLGVTAYDLSTREAAKGHAPDLAAEIARAEREAEEMDARRAEERRALAERNEEPGDE